MKPRILIVDDEAPIRTMLAFSLHRADMRVSVAADGDAALQMLESGERPDLILVDWMMPGLDGLQLTRRVRQHPELGGIPIIMLTARGNQHDRSLGLDSGADDYVVKPFSNQELISRVRAVLRRSRPQHPEAECFRIRELQLDTESRRVMAGDRPVAMGPTEYRLLELFMRHAGRAWSRRQLLTAIWGDTRAVEERTVDVHIRRLRKALEPTGADRYVQTVRGHGYRFSEVC